MEIVSIDVTEQWRGIGQSSPLELVLQIAVELSKPQTGSAAVQLDWLHTSSGSAGQAKIKIFNWQNKKNILLEKFQ